MVGARDYFCGRVILANWGPSPQKRAAIHIKGFLKKNSGFLHVDKI
jgi:hypothetical protein